ncbi:lasso peptide biosynthesis B2 protein [Georgenia sp. MJ173]|uniref:lasso peptide biosynthesis B2 protein n=1 Tax=Georgenia sunbinii TaxID=3117728 RepID=UPI002F2632FC
MTWRVRDYRAVARALIVQARIEWKLRRRQPLPQLARTLGVPLVTDTTRPATELFTERLTREERRSLRAVQRVLRHWPWDDTCLRRALATGHVLRHRGPSLRVGVAKTDGAVRAHAWLEIDGRTLDPDAPAEYLSLVDPRGGAA